MPRTMIWLLVAIRVAIAPVLVGALALLADTPRTWSNQAAAPGLLLLAAIHVLYWWRPWPSQHQQRRAVAAIAGMLVINFVLLNLVLLNPSGADEPLLWLYPALIAGARADRVHALGGTLEFGAGEGRRFRLRVRLGAAAPSHPNGEVGR